MPRRARIESGTGIFHVMMRGINHQNIFEDEEDCWQFINTLDRMRVRYNDEGKPCGTNCIYYAYCLMSNHIHLLIREREDTIGMAIKRIASSYVYYYNHKYSRDGHLFRERYKSEPVNDMAYFVTLLRYIHQESANCHIKNQPTATSRINQLSHQESANCHIKNQPTATFIVKKVAEFEI